MMDFPVKRKTPRVKQDRLILHFVRPLSRPNPSLAVESDHVQDYDCFYAQVVENAQPALKSLPLGIKQKSILATCNYVARSRGVRKLQRISEAKKVCPDLILADGEDLSAFRDVSKRLYGLLRAYSWNKKVERLGLDEVFFDATDIVEYNVGFLNLNALADSFFCLSRDDPEKGFSFDGSAIAGCLAGTGHDLDNMDNGLYVRLLLASHLARYLRLKIEEEGYTSACGISTNKLLSKLAGSLNKPRNQTTVMSLHEEEIFAFMDAHGLRKVPGIGGKITHALESFYLGRDADTDTYTEGSAVTVGQFRAHPDVSPQMLEKLLGSRPGSEKGIGEKVWGLLHGVDDAEVKAASNVPTQISIEDTYPGPTGGLNTAAELERELLKLTASLLRRMHVDLIEDEDETSQDHPSISSNGVDAQSQISRRRRKWLAHPKTLRLSARPKTSLNDGKPYNWGRASRSQPLPTFIFTGSTNTEDEAIVARLVKETLLSMFYSLYPDESGWNIGMINICVANMVPTAAEPGAAGSGRDISQMFRRQEDVLREFRVRDEDDDTVSEEMMSEKTYQGNYSADPEDVMEPDGADFIEPESEMWGDLDGVMTCDKCGHKIPPFAMAAHMRYHDFGDT